MDRAVQELYHSLILSGAVGRGLVLSETDTTPDGGKPSPLVYRTKDRDWVLVASLALCRDSFLRLAETSMAHALDYEGVTTESALVCETLDEDLRAASERLDVTVFEVKSQKSDPVCGFCGSPLNGSVKDGGFNACGRCERLFGHGHSVRICQSCLVAYGANPDMDERLKGIAVDSGVPWPTMTLCPVCRAGDRKALLTMDIVVKGVTEGAITSDRLKETGLPREILQLINLRTQARR